MGPPDLLPMLATSGVPRSLEGWRAEPKLDGWRGRLLVSDGELVLRTRGGRDVAANVPSVGALRDSGHALVLDGELVAGAGRAEDFYQLAGALARRGRGLVAVTFVAFDLLWQDGELLTGAAHHVRRGRLEELQLCAFGVPVVPSFHHEDAPMLFAACEQLGAEGLVLKAKRGTYRPGVRSSSWRKVKTLQWRTHLERRFGHRFG